MVIAQYEERRLPYDYDAEAAVLGALLIDCEAWHRTQSIVKADDSHRACHQFIYAAMSTMAGRSGALDQITVAQGLSRQGRAESVGGQPYPKGLAELNVAKHRNGPTGSVHLAF